LHHCAATGDGATFYLFNGFIVFDDPQWAEYTITIDPVTLQNRWDWQGLGQWNWWPWQIPIAEPPNNFIAPYWTDLTIDNNRYQRVEDVCSVPVAQCLAWVEGQCVDWYVGSVWAPCDWSWVTRPPGRLLVTTLGEAPNRVWVVEWLNARNVWTGNLCTFELQLYEGSNAILCLYEDFQTKDAGGPYFEIPSVLIGGEDYFATNVGHFGETYEVPGGWHWWPWSEHVWSMWVRELAGVKWMSWYLSNGQVPQPMAAGTMRGFIY
jgi:hypothetical protein